MCDQKIPRATALGHEDMKDDTFRPETVQNCDMGMIEAPSDRSRIRK
jgi:hypothetical protein